MRDQQLGRRAVWQIAMALDALASFVVLFCVVATFFNVLRLLRKTTQASALRVAATAVAIPLTWAACAAAGVILLPWVVGFVWLMIDSLRS
jgi:hypothetical protein